MDTPEKSNIGTPVSKFEDSPVFNYINSLSPIKPVKSLNITQTFSSLNFGSLPSVFTSPHVASHKESRFLRRYSVSDSSKPELSSEENGAKVELYDNSAEQPENSALVVGNESSKSVIELSRTLSYDSGSPNCLSTPQGVEAGFASELAEPSTSLDPSARDSGETRYHELCLGEQRKEGSVCDWESLISDSADILIFNSPNGSEGFKGLSHNPLEPVTRLCFPQGNVNSDHRMQIVGPVGSEQQREELFSQTGDASQPSDFDPMEDMFYNDANTNTGMASDPSERKGKEAETQVAFSCKSVLSLHRGVRRRCLDFEMVGARTKSSIDGSNGSSSRSQPDERITANEKKLGPLRLCEPSRRVLPGIGLHLNALATTSKDCKIIKNDNHASGIQIRIPNSNVQSLHSPTTGQEALDKSLAPGGSAEMDSNSYENGVQILQDGSLATDEFNQNSPKKKKRRLENGGETEGCKRCNCKKSKCLKLYCECFAAGVYCIEPCSCQECFNKPIHEDTVLATRKQIESRNPLAFAPKVIRGSDSVPEYGGHDELSKTPASARHKRGCNCKKSSCLKKYCECYQGGVGCSVNCRCEGCKNAFGRKDGSPGLIDAVAEPDEEEKTVDKTSREIELHDNRNEDRNPRGSTLPMTPLRIPRPLVPLPFSSKGKPPRSSSFLAVAAASSSSSGLYGHKLAKPSILRSQPKFEKHTQTVPDNAEFPEILRGDGSPIAGIKTLSPNSKRISPPQCHFGSPGGRRRGRKLILQSIPSFPSLTPHQ